MARDVKDDIKDLNLGQKIKTLRQRMGLSMRDMAENTDLSEPLLAQIEGDVVAPPVATLLKISKALRVNIGYFFQDQDSGGEMREVSYEMQRSGES